MSLQIGKSVAKVATNVGFQSVFPAVRPFASNPPQVKRRLFFHAELRDPNAARHSTCPQSVRLFKSPGRRPNGFLRLSLNDRTRTILHLQGRWGGWPTGNGKKLSSSQAQLGQATCLAVA